VIFGGCIFPVPLSTTIQTDPGSQTHRRTRRNTPEVDRPAPLTVQQLAVELACSEDDVRALIRTGELRTVSCGIRPGRVPHHELDAYRRRIRHRA
jgi:excisionase family DNA binding protein